ncbi:MAG: NAD(P)H-dependent oxidoreductase [Actinobacteria bacterium]|nr:NAD(P)H-dependent oxidoreductase [Actinomycetota bacterium]
MIASDRAGHDLFFVGIGGSTRAGSSTETLVRAVLDGLERRGARTALYTGPALILPPYEQTPDCRDAGAALIGDVRRSDGLVVGSPGYHGTISGLVKNVLDFLEELSGDDPPYLDRRPVGCVTTAYGWQAAVNTLTTLRQVVHALRGWPTPYGVAANVAGGLLRQDGSFSDSRLGDSVDVVAGQMFEFAVAMRATAAAR